MLQNSAVKDGTQRKTPAPVGRAKSHRAHGRSKGLKDRKHQGTLQQPSAPQPSSGEGTGQSSDSLVGFLALLSLILLVVIIKAFGGRPNRRLRSRKNSIATYPKQAQPVLNGSSVGTSPAVQLRKPALKPPAGVWMPPGSVVEICGHRIDGGMVYVGSHLPQISGHGIEPALIDPGLPITEAPLGYTGQDMPYWPSYSAVSPQARGLYLRWLAGGRQDQNVAIGIVFLFFYGLERRLLAESNAVAVEERKLLVQELDRLLSVYRDSNSLWGYARQLCDVIRLQVISPDAIDQLVPEYGHEHSRGVSIALRALLGRMADTDRPLPSEWALRWVECDFGYYPRTPAQRCRDEFVRLFRIRYRLKYGEGFTLNKTNARIRSEYRPASASFFGHNVTLTIGLPDVAASEEPIGQFRNLANECLDELDKYSQFLGRHRENRVCPEALALLPVELLHEHPNEHIIELIQWLNSVADGRDLATIEFKELESKWPEIHSDHFGKQEAVSLAECLERLGFGIEPDIRFGSYAPSPEGKLVFFKLPTGAPSNPTPSMRTALLTLRLGAMVLAASEMNGSDDEEHLVGILSATYRLDPTERQRLRAKLHWLLLSKPSTLRDKKRIESLDLKQRTIIGRFLVGVTGAAGHVSPLGVRALEKVYRLLGLESESLYSDLQSASTTPITVQERDSGSRRYAIPQPFKPDGEGKGRIEIDMTKVSAMQAETERVSGLLREIFVDEEEPVHKPAPAQDSILGLDHAQSEFLRRLAAKSSWSRADLEAMASEYKILLDGAIEAINEATLDTLGGSLLEGETQIEVNSNILKELRL